MVQGKFSVAGVRPYPSAQLSILLRLRMQVLGCAGNLMFRFRIVAASMPFRRRVARPKNCRHSQLIHS